MFKFQMIKSILLSVVLIACATTSWSFYTDNVSGTWFHDGRTVTIEKSGFDQYLFCNEDRNCANGFFSGNRSIQVSQWSVSGVLSQHGRTIEWSNGTQWTRYPNHHNGQLFLTGQWFHNGQPTRIQMRTNRDFLLINEMGQSNIGYLQGNILIIPSLNIRGYLSSDENQIKWSNNTIWVRNY
jgi:hypothetical protein